MSFQDTWSDDDDVFDGPRTRFPDLAVRSNLTRADKVWMIAIFGLVGAVGIVIVVMAFVGFGPSFTERCQHAGGVVVDDQCIHKGAIIKLP